MSENIPAQVPAVLYDRISDPLAAVERLGEIFTRCGFFGVEKPEQGQMLALVCMFERKSPIAIQRRFHIVDGSLTTKASAMLATLRTDGGDHEWLTEDTDAEKAVLKIWVKGKEKPPVTYTWADAQLSVPSCNKPGSAWVKTRSAMLRAAAIRKAIIMHCPEYSVLEGDESEGMNVIQDMAATSPLAPAPAAPRPTEPDVASLRSANPAPAAPEAAKPRAKRQAPAAAPAGVDPFANPAPTEPANVVPMTTPPPAPAPAAPPPPPAPAPAPAPAPVASGVFRAAVGENGKLTPDTVNALLQVIGAAAVQAWDWFSRKQWLAPNQNLEHLHVARAQKILDDPAKFRAVIMTPAQPPTTPA